MSRLDLSFKYVSSYAEKLNVKPLYATEGSAGCDLFACIEAPVVIKKGETKLIPTGIAIGLPSPSYAALVFSRSGLATKNGIAMANGVGLIDSDYRGEIKCPLINLGCDDFTVMPGFKIAQLVLIPVFLANLIEVKSLDDTYRGEGGFGSTGL